MYLGGNFQVRKWNYIMAVKKYKKQKGYESLNREFLQRNDLSLEARGLLSYMESMPDNYIFHKTKLYTCFEKNKKTSVERIWNELLDQNFIIAYSKGKKPKQKFEYLFTHEGFSEETIHELNEEYLSSGWEIAYRSGTNRKPASYYRKKRTIENDAISSDPKPSVNQGVENQHPDNHGIATGVDFEQHKTDSTKSTGIKSINKGLLINDEDEEKNKKETPNSKNEISEKENKDKVEQLKKTLSKKWGETVSKSLFDEAEINTQENLKDIAYYWSYLLVAIKKAEEKYVKFDVEPSAIANSNSFFIPMEGPWNN